MPRVYSVFRNEGMYDAKYHTSSVSGSNDAYRKNDGASEKKGEKWEKVKLARLWASMRTWQFEAALSSKARKFPMRWRPRYCWEVATCGGDRLVLLHLF